MDQSFYVYIGLLASVLIAISIMMTNIKAFRIINLIGAATFATYGYLIQSLPVFGLNFFNACVDIFYLIKISRQKTYFTLNTTLTGQEFFFKEFLKFYNEDIKKFFPDFDFQKVENPIIFLISREMNPVGLFICELEQDGVVTIHLDYSCPAYRDFKNARFLMNESKQLIEDNNVHTLKAHSKVWAHQKYLLKLGFEKSLEEENLYVKKVG